MYTTIVLLTCLCVCTYAAKSPQQQRCDALNSVVNRDRKAQIVQCSVGQGCFSLDCQPTPSIPAVLLTNTDFHIFIEPCKHPAAILVNASLRGSHYSHEFTHTETVSLPKPANSPIDPKLSVVLDNSDSKVIVFSVVLDLLGFGNYTIVPKTRFPLNNITCIDGHIATSQHPSHPSTAPHTFPTHCIDTCEAVHNMVKSTKPLCHSTASCLTINCNSPKAPSGFSIINLTSSYTILPCEQPPVVEARLDDNTNNIHIVRNLTHNTTIPINLPLPINLTVHITLVDVNQYSILFGVTLRLGSISIPILPDRVIPIDRSHCSWYTGPSSNPLCTTTPQPSTHTPHQSMSSPNPPNHHTTSIPTVGPGPTGSNRTREPIRLQGVSSGVIAGIIMGILLTTLIIVAASVSVTMLVVFLVLKKRSQAVYSYSQFRALEEDD